MVGIIENEHLKLAYLTGAGPRIVGLYRQGQAQNYLAELPDAGWETPYGRYHLHGGHRLWRAPEHVPLSALPDDCAVEVQQIPQGVRLTGPVEAYGGLQKTLHIELLPNCPAVKITHVLTNAGATPLEVAPWAITNLPTGGVAILPQHGHALDVHGLLPNRNLVFWPYTCTNDPRLEMGEAVWYLRSSADEQKLKIGYLNLTGWIAYLCSGLLFCKRFTPQPTARLVDMGCNTEVYMDAASIELETIGPLDLLAPGASAVHIETWECYLAGEELPEDLRMAVSGFYSAGRI